MIMYSAAKIFLNISANWAIVYLCISNSFCSHKQKKKKKKKKNQVVPISLNNLIISFVFSFAYTNESIIHHSHWIRFKRIVCNICICLMFNSQYVSLPISFHYVRSLERACMKHLNHLSQTKRNTYCAATKQLYISCDTPENYRVLGTSAEIENAFS